MYQNIRALDQVGWEKTMNSAVKRALDQWYVDT